MKGPAPGMVYPVPWAETELTSFLKTPDEICDLLTAAGVEITKRENLRDFAIEFFREAFAKAANAGGLPPIGLHLLTGGNSREKFTNYAQALNDNQIEPVIVIARKR